MVKLCVVTCAPFPANSVTQPLASLYQCAQNTMLHMCRQGAFSMMLYGSS